MRLLAVALGVAGFLPMAAQAQPQIGGGTCTVSTLNGIYYYLLSGALVSGGAVYPYVELGKLVADGKGGVSGNSHASIGGPISAYTLTGAYSIQPSCTGSMTLSVNGQAPSSLTFQIVNGGQGAVVAFSSPGGVITGRAYRQTASADPIQCSTASLSGSFAYLFTGVTYLSGNAYLYSQTGNVTPDGRGSISATGTANVNGATLTASAQGSYSLAPDCSGTASFVNPNSTTTVFIAVVNDGQAILFMDSDPSYTVGGIAEPSFSSGVVNAATLRPGGIAPNEFVSIKGTGLGPATGVASTMKTSLAGTSVYINGTAAPLTYAQDGQINALVPFSVAGSGSATIQAEFNGRTGNVVTVPVVKSSPGIFTQDYGPGQVWLANADGTFNSSSNPAARKSYVAFWTTGQGLVDVPQQDGIQPSGPPYPIPLLPVSVSLGNVVLPDENIVFKGLVYSGELQLNLLIPDNAPTGDAVPLVVTIGGASSRTDATIAIK